MSKYIEYQQFVAVLVSRREIVGQLTDRLQLMREISHEMRLIAHKMVLIQAQAPPHHSEEVEKLEARYKALDLQLAVFRTQVRELNAKLYALQMDDNSNQ